MRPLADLCNPAIETIDHKRNQDREFWYVDISAVNNITKTISTPQRVKGRRASVRARQLIKARDVLVATTRPNLNAVALVPNEYDQQVCSTGFCVLRCGPELDPDYLYCFVRSNAFIEPLVDLVKGALYPAVTDKQVLSRSIPWVPLVLQRRIAAQLKAHLAIVEQTRQAAQAQVKDSVHFIRRYREEVSEQLENAECVPMRGLLEGIEAGKSIQTSERLATDEELAVLKVSAISWTEFRPNEAKAIGAVYKPEDRHRVRAGDIIVSRANTIELVGAVVRVDRDYPFRLLSDKTLRLVVNEKLVDPDYLVQALRMPEAREHIEQNATGTSDSMRNISQEALRATPVRLPSLTIQRQIAKRARDVESTVRRLQAAFNNQIEEIELLPARLLAQTFADS
ncbi:MAG: hypothetical protein H8K07_08870 [Nitrospira sp.]|nr:hypothetical protein [Nitrospira sp.]